MFRTPRENARTGVLAPNLPLRHDTRPSPAAVPRTVTPPSGASHTATRSPPIPFAGIGVRRGTVRTRALRFFAALPVVNRLVPRPAGARMAAAERHRHRREGAEQHQATEHVPDLHRDRLHPCRGQAHRGATSRTVRTVAALPHGAKPHPAGPRVSTTTPLTVHPVKPRIARSESFGAATPGGRAMRRILLAVGGGLFLFAGPEARVAYVTFNGLSATVSADGVENGESKARCKGVNSGAMTTSSTQVPAASSKRLPPPRGRPLRAPSSRTASPRSPSAPRRARLRGCRCSACPRSCRRRTGPVGVETGSVTDPYGRSLAA